MPAPTIWAAMNGSAEDGAMPAKVSEKIRPMVTAGLANEVEEVYQYAAPMYALTAADDSGARPDRDRAKISPIRPVVATTSPSRTAGRLS
ncbi:MAG TPA: hypothetical protein VHN80_15605 [Kineosporiaceae bacterium]|nr:hypothetical protein [Kineosporiaceae bacterium]